MSTVGKKTTYERKAPRPRSKLMKLATEIQSCSPVNEMMAFQHTIFSHCGIPRANVDEREFKRRDGDIWIILQAGYLDGGPDTEPRAQPLPYGPLPRMILSFIATRVSSKENGSNRIKLGRNGADFMRRLGLSDTQGKRYATVVKQLEALAACRFQFGRGRHETYNGQPIRAIGRAMEQGDLWIEVDEAYAASIRASRMPFDFRAQQALSGSSLAIDIYLWLARRLRMISAAEGQKLSWSNLRSQFGQEFKKARDFRTAFRSALGQVLKVYPAAKIDDLEHDGGLVLYASLPPVPERVAEEIAEIEQSSHA